MQNMTKRKDFSDDNSTASKLWKPLSTNLYNQNVCVYQWYTIHVSEN